MGGRRVSTSYDTMYPQCPSPEKASGFWKVRGCVHVFSFGLSEDDEADLTTHHTVLVSMYVPKMAYYLKCRSWQDVVDFNLAQYVYNSHYVLHLAESILSLSSDYTTRANQHVTEYGRACSRRTWVLTVHHSFRPRLLIDPTNAHLLIPTVLSLSLACSLIFGVFFFETAEREN